RSSDDPRVGRPYHDPACRGDASRLLLVFAQFNSRSASFRRSRISASWSTEVMSNSLIDPRRKPGAAPTRPPETLTPAMIWRAVQRWWPWALATGLILAIVGDAMVWWTFKPTYRATARLAIKDQPDYLAFKSSEPSGRFVQNQVELIRSPQVLEKVLEKQEIAQFPEVLQEPAPFEWLQKNVMVRNLGGSEFFELSFTDNDATHAAAIANAICDS